MAQIQPDGFLALPAGGAGRPVLVLHAWWGLNDTFKQVCTRLADAGFVAFAPDLYNGEIAQTIAEAETLSSAIFGNLAPARADVARAATYLSERAGDADSPLAVVGFSMGAFFALDLSISATTRVGAVVVFYGTHPGDFAASQASYLGHFAEDDAYEAQADVDALEAALQRAGRPFTFHQYAGTGHWFFEPDREDVYDPVAATLAWDRTLAFLHDFARG